MDGKAFREGSADAIMGRESANPYHPIMQPLRSAAYLSGYIHGEALMRRTANG